LLVLLACVSMPARAAESDVHFGLTRFLAIQAGFDEGQADAIGFGNQRVEAGDMQYVALLFDYACLARDTELAAEVAARSYPAAASAPRPSAQRGVAAGGDAALAAVRKLDSIQPSQAGFRLYQLGEALHVLQDSFSHQGVPDTPQVAALFPCDAEMSWAHPRARGGWNSHAADLTHRWPADTLEMAKATYAALLRYPAIGTTPRQPAPWAKVAPLLDGFIKANTKAAKQAWFKAQGFEDTSFLAGTSLRDGAAPFELEWDGRHLPPLQEVQSRQHDTDPALLEFFSRFFNEWLGSDDFDKLARAHGAPAAGPGGADKNAALTELAARLRLWRMRDHGAVAELAHAPARLGAVQLAELARLARAPKALARYAQPAEALFPLVTNTKAASPLLPFIVRQAPNSAAGNARAVAVAKLKHAPYDSIGVVGEQIGGRWKIVGIVGAVDH
jgi:hypothetical protein